MSLKPKKNKTTTHTVRKRTKPRKVKMFGYMYGDTLWQDTDGTYYFKCRMPQGLSYTFTSIKYKTKKEAMIVKDKDEVEWIEERGRNLFRY